MSVVRDEPESTTNERVASSEPTADLGSTGDGRESPAAGTTNPHDSAPADASALASDRAPADGAGSASPPAEPTESGAEAPVAVVLPAASEQAPLAVEPPVPSGPYRTPPYEAPAPAYGGRVMRPLLGPSLGMFGVLLWAYVVAGQLTTSWITGRPLGNGIAVAAVVLATFAAWGLGMRRSVDVAPGSPSVVVGRGIGALALGFAMFVATLVFAVFVGTTAAPGHDFGIAFGLVLVAFVAVVVGRRLVTPEIRERTHGERVVTVALWVTCLLLTFVAGVDLAANG